MGVAPGEEVSDEDFKEQLETLNEELETLNAQARDLEQTIARNVAEILEALTMATIDRTGRLAKSQTSSRRDVRLSATITAQNSSERDQLPFDKMRSDSTRELHSTERQTR